jgi:glutamate formiminotransferase
MSDIFECVPNVSEGRDAGVIGACARAIRSAGVSLANVSSDADHHRSVFTFFGDRATVLAASVALATVATETIDLRGHDGAHPRIGALDVLPFVPMGATTMNAAALLAHDAARAIWERCGVPSFFYGYASSGSRSLPDVRRGGFEPDVGEPAAHPTAGAIAVGAREVLVAFNIVLAGIDIAGAREIARAIRERDGGLRGVRALGIPLGHDRVQVSCNLTDVSATPLHVVVDTVRVHAIQRGGRLVESELIGLVPRAALGAAVAYRFGV